MEKKHLASRDDDEWPRSEADHSREAKKNRNDTHDACGAPQYLKHTAKLAEVVEWRFYGMGALRGTSTGIGCPRSGNGHLHVSDRASVGPPDTYPAHQGARSEEVPAGRPSRVVAGVLSSLMSVDQVRYEGPGAVRNEGFDPVTGCLGLLTKMGVGLRSCRQAGRLGLSA